MCSSEDMKRVKVSYWDPPSTQISNLYSSQIGPPDSMREHLVAAAKAMMKADWKTCADTLLAHKIWGLMPRAEEVSFFLW